MELSYSPNGAITVTVEQYIRRVCSEVGVAHMEDCTLPSGRDLFHSSKNCTPVDVKYYQRLSGYIIHAIKVRHDVRKECVHLSTKRVSPDESDLSKLIQVFRYLHTTADIALTFYTDEGVILCAYVDASFGVHSNGSSHTGGYCCIGRTNTPIWTYSAPQVDVALAPMQGEYYGLSDIAKRVLFFFTISYGYWVPTE